MAKNSVNDYSSTAGNNTDIQSVNIAEGMAPSNVNNAIREMMADIADLAQGGVTATSIKAAAFAAGTATVTTLILGTGTYTAVASSRQVIAGQGLSGGGTLEADRTINLDVSDLTATATSAAGDYFPIYRTAATGTYKVLKSDLAASTSAPGFVELATEAEAQGLTATGVVLTPASIATLGAPILVDTITTSSGSSVTSSTLPACRAFLVLFADVSASGTAALQCNISDDDGGNWSGNLLPTAAQSGAYARHGSVLITGSGTTGNKVTQAVIGSDSGGDVAIRTAVVSSVTGVINKLRFPISATAYDGGTIYVLGYR